MRIIDAFQSEIKNASEGISLTITESDGIYDLVLRSEIEFDKQHSNDVKFRKNNL